MDIITRKTIQNKIWKQMKRGPTKPLLNETQEYSKTLK